jgi:CheY-like chemotaxis protein
MDGEPLLVLLVEDNPDHAELVIRSLGEHRVANKITHLSDGQTALDYLLHQGEYANSPQYSYPHVILLDLRLPRIDGLQVLKVLKETEALRQIPVVILTTSEAEQDIARAYNFHANSYLVKPIGFEEFEKMMQDLGFYWLAWNTHPKPQ